MSTGTHYHRPSYLYNMYNGISYTAKKASLYWFGAQIITRNDIDFVNGLM